MDPKQVIYRNEVLREIVSNAVFAHAPVCSKTHEVDGMILQGIRTSMISVVKTRVDIKEKTVPEMASENWQIRGRGKHGKAAYFRH